MGGFFDDIGKEIGRGVDGLVGTNISGDNPNHSSGIGSTWNQIREHNQDEFRRGDIGNFIDRNLGRTSAALAGGASDTLVSIQAGRPIDEWSKRSFNRAQGAYWAGNPLNVTSGGTAQRGIDKMVAGEESSIEEKAQLVGDAGKRGIQAWSAYGAYSAASGWSSGAISTKEVLSYGSAGVTAIGAIKKGDYAGAAAALAGAGETDPNWGDVAGDIYRNIIDPSHPSGTRAGGAFDTPPPDSGGFFGTSEGLPVMPLALATAAIVGVVIFARMRK